MPRRPRPPPTRQSQKADTRARLLKVARKHLAHHGFDGTSFRAIAREAGVALGTVVLHFTDKRGLLHAALYDDLAEVVEEGVRAEIKGPLIDRVSAVVAPAYAYYARRPALSRVLLQSALFADSPWRERFAEQTAQAHLRIVALAEAAKASGELATDVDAATFGAAALAFYYVTLIAWAGGAQPDPLATFRVLLEQHIRATAPTRAGRSPTK